MTFPDEPTYDRAVWRIPRIMAVIGILGTAVSLGVHGWKGGAGFVLGALISAAQYIWLKTAVDGMAGSPVKGSVRRAVRRFAVLAAAAYVIFEYSPVSLTAALAGIFVLTAAVFVEVGIEIIVYARK